MRALKERVGRASLREWVQSRELEMEAISRVVGAGCCAAREGGGAAAGRLGYGSCSGDAAAD